MYTYTNNRTSGFSTIELLIAFAIFFLILPPLMMLMFGGQTATLDTALTNTGVMHVATDVRDAFAELTGDWDATFSPVTSAPYTYTTSVVDVSPCLKEIGSRADWDSEHNRTQYAAASTFIPNIDEAKKFGGGCDAFPPSDWDNPENPSGWHTSPSDLEGTQSGIDVETIDGHTYAFITTTNTSASQKDDLWIINVDDPDNPTLVAQLDTGGPGGNTKGLTDIDVVRTPSGAVYAYVVQNYEVDQLQTVDVSNPALPVLTSTISFEPHGVLVTGTDPEGRVIRYYNGRLYAGLKTTEGPELLVFSVSADPAHPSYVGKIDEAFNHTINDIAFKDGYAYLATGYDSRELMIVDISGNTPTDTGEGYNANETGGDTEDGTAIYINGDTLYLGRARVNNANEKDFYMFDISDPTDPTVIKSKRLGFSNSSTLGTPRVLDIIVQGRIGFFVTTDPTEPFTVFDVITDPDDIVVVNPLCDNSVNLTKLVEIAYKGNLVFGTNGNQASLSILRDNPDVCPL